MYPSMPASPLYPGQQAALPASASPLGTPLGTPGTGSNPMSNLYSTTGSSAPNGPAGMLYQIISMLMSVLSQLQGIGSPSQASPAASPGGSASDSTGGGNAGSSANAGSPTPSNNSAGNAGGPSNNYGGGGGGHCHGRGRGHGQGPGGSPSAGPSPYGPPTPTAGGPSNGYPTPSSGGYPSPTAGGYPGGTGGATPGGYPSPSGGSTGNLFGNGKEGLGVNDTSDNGNGSNLGSTKASWYYNWAPGADSSKVNDPNATFVPMIWGNKNMNPQDLQKAANSKSPMILTFNEPDLPEQANMTPQQALSQWGKLEATGKKLSSPAISNSEKPGQGVQWLDQFMKGAAAGGHRVDSIALHWYGDKNKSPQENVNNMKNYLDKVHQKYPNLPIDLTEFGVSPNGLHAQKDPAFLAAAEKMLNGLPYVQMYSPYGLGDINGNK